MENQEKFPKEINDQLETLYNNIEEVTKQIKKEIYEDKKLDEIVKDHVIKISLLPNSNQLNQVLQEMNQAVAEEIKSNSKAGKYIDSIAMGFYDSIKALFEMELDEDKKLSLIHI